MDTTTVEAAITAAGANIETIGLAIIAVAAIVFTFRWIKAAFF